MRDRHLTLKVANKCLNVRERVEVVEWNQRLSPPSPCCPVNRQCLCRKPWYKEKGSQVKFFQRKLWEVLGFVEFISFTWTLFKSMLVCYLLKIMNSLLPQAASFDFLKT